MLHNALALDIFDRCFCFVNWVLFIAYIGNFGILKIASWFARRHNKVDDYSLLYFAPYVTANNLHC